jgi:hypothetical protein
MDVAHHVGVTTVKELDYIFGSSTIAINSQMSVLLIVCEYERVNTFIEMYKPLL